MDAEIFIRYGGASAAMVRVFWELCVVFCDEVECRATVGHVTQSMSGCQHLPPFDAECRTAPKRSKINRTKTIRIDPIRHGAR